MPSPADVSAPVDAAWTFEAIGVPWSIEAPGGVPAAAREAVARRIARFDADWSRFRDDSLVARIAAAAGSWPLPPDAAPLLGLYEQLYALTGGRMSPLVGASLERLGYDAAYRLEPSGPPLAAPAWEDAITLVRSADGDLRLDAAAPVTLDVGAAGKGLLVDLVGAELLEHGVSDAVVDASGDLRAWGGTGIRVALQNPANPGKAIGVVELADGRALCASALDRRRWGEGLHHIVDAVTGRPVDEGVIGTFAVADSALVADGAATALFLADPQAIGDRLGVEWVRMLSNGSIESSADWKGELFR